MSLYILGLGGDRLLFHIWDICGSEIIQDLSWFQVKNVLIFYYMGSIVMCSVGDIRTSRSGPGPVGTQSFRKVCWLLIFSLSMPVLLIYAFSVMLTLGCANHVPALPAASLLVLLKRRASKTWEAAFQTVLFSAPVRSSQQSISAGAVDTMLQFSLFTPATTSLCFLRNSSRTLPLLTGLGATVFSSELLSSQPSQAASPWKRSGSLLEGGSHLQVTVF